MMHLLVTCCKYLQNAWYTQVQDFVSVFMHPHVHMHFSTERVHSFHQILKGAMTQKRLKTSVLEGHKLTCFASIRELNV